MSDDPKDEAADSMLTAIRGLPVGAVVLLCDEGAVHQVVLRSNIVSGKTIVFILRAALERFERIQSGEVHG